MTIYYVYAYLREDSTPYYIGKGKGGRAYDNNDHIKHGIYLPEDDSRIVILHTNLEESQALDIETTLIKQYGRKDLGTGILYNKTDGGVNPVLPGKLNGMWGKTLTDEHRMKISLAKRGTKYRPRIQSNAPL
jgi:hypothetical protein